MKSTPKRNQIKNIINPNTCIPATAEKSTGLGSISQYTNFKEMSNNYSRVLKPVNKNQWFNNYSVHNFIGTKNINLSKRSPTIIDNDMEDE